MKMSEEFIAKIGYEKGNVTVSLATKIMNHFRYESTAWSHSCKGGELVCLCNPRKQAAPGL